jgi:hypothetical protein
VNLRFRTGKSFRRALARLTPAQREAAAKAFAIFRQNPFDPRLRVHKIHKLSAAYGKTIHAAYIHQNLRVVFYLEGDTVWSVDIGTHEIYRE